LNRQGRTDVSGTWGQKEVARQIFERTMGEIDVTATVRRAVSRDGNRLRIVEEEVDLRAFSRVVVVAVGKASVAMAEAMEEILGERLTDGLVVTNARPSGVELRLPIFLGGHPVPNVGSLEAATLALELLHRLDGPETLLLFLLSGGGSAIFERPVDPSIELSDLQEVNRVLVQCGAVIGEMNVVRRSLSAVKGGRLADAAPQSRQISLYLSDVNDDDLATVASGPTLPDPAPPEALAEILRRYDLLARFPRSVRDWLRRGAGVASSSGGGAGVSRTHHLLLDNRQALEVARKIAEQDFGLKVDLATDLVEEEVQLLAEHHLDRFQALCLAHPGQAVCLLSGGEAICPVRGTGQGGRNQEFVLRLVLEMERRGGNGIAVLSAGTDGIDGNSPAAGAAADVQSLQRARQMGLLPEESLAGSDAFALFSALGETIITGPTGNNVRDLRILLTSQPFSLDQRGEGEILSSRPLHG
jgi:glycerate 2-kinase